jgi:hypothetical protein
MEAHRRGLQTRREANLTCEKYAIHLDGEGDGQWADLYHGERLSIPPAFPGQLRVSENLLRPITDNAVAYHTTAPFRFVVDARPDREAKQRAIVDQALINHLQQKQKWNRVFAEAMQLAMPAGHCPVHAFWRDDLESDPYEPAYGGSDSESEDQNGQPQVSLRRGIIDAYVGDPFDTAYGAGSRRNSLHIQTHGRTLPLEVVQAAFSQVPGIESLTGSTRLPSAARFQRIVRQWTLQGLEVHGTAAARSGRNKEELVAIICREIAPGMDPEFPGGRITLVALGGTATTEPSEGSGSHGKPFLLHDGPLPAGRFSSVRVYSANRFDDIHGKPFLGDLSDLQVQLNQALSLRAEYIRRSVRPPLVTGGMVVEDTAVWEDDAQLEMDPGSTVAPQFLQLRIDVGTLNQHIDDLRSAMYTIGGYQAASRGESHSGDSGAKVVALAKADDTIHGPTNQRFRESVEEFAGLNHALFREYGDIPWLIESSGDEFSHMIEQWVDRSMVSDQDPAFRLTSGFGATMESRANQLLQLVGQTGADGEPLMSTRQFRSAWPDQSIYPEAEDPIEVRERRAKTINARIRRMAMEMEQRLGELATDPRFLIMQHMALLSEFPVLPDDMPDKCFDTLSSITQDENESPVARELAKYRQGLYQMWLQTGQGPMPAMIENLMMQAEAQPAQVGPQGPPPQQGPPVQMQEQANPGGTTMSEAMSPNPGEIAALTAEAGAPQ